MGFCLFRKGFKLEYCPLDGALSQSTFARDFTNSKNNTAVYDSSRKPRLENKIFCTEIGCDFYTKINHEELKEHTVNVHNYGEYSCADPHCDYIGFSKVSLHVPSWAIYDLTHTRMTNSDFLEKLKSPWQNAYNAFG